MVKFVVMFHNPDNLGAFENAYNDFLALVERMPGIARRQVVSITGSPTGEARYYRMLEIYFEDMMQMQESLRSPGGQEAGAELVRRFPRGGVETLIAEVFEETGGRTVV
jgi:uncharacterized protein (TIGR02118 family)